MFNRILVPTDFSEPSDAALDYARTLADKFGASIHVLHIIELHTSGAFSGESYIGPSLYEMQLKEAQSKLAVRVLPADRARYGATSEVMTGIAADTIVEFAEDQHIDLIVMGTHGRTGLAHLLMGSVAEHVVRRSPCPVLTVRHAPAAEAVTVSRSGQTSQFDSAPGPG